jgi:hypothetical protein
MGGGNAQKSATARARNLEKADKQKVRYFVYRWVRICIYHLCESFRSRTPAVEPKERRLAVAETWRLPWPQRKVFIVIAFVVCSLSRAYHCQRTFCLRSQERGGEEEAGGGWQEIMPVYAVLFET